MGERVPGVGQRVSRFVNSHMEISCPSFYTLHHGRGCSFDPGCFYCFLQRTFRRLPEGKAWHQYPEEEVLRHLDQWLQSTKLDGEGNGLPAIINAGELADSFAADLDLIARVAERFTNTETNPHGRVLLTVTKAANPVRVRHVLDRAASAGPMEDRIIVSATLNAPQFVADLEEGTPPVEQRLAMLKEIREHFPEARLRVRIDPIAGWYDGGYQWLCNRVREIRPELVTLGSFRLYPQDKAWFRFPQDCDPEKFAAINRVWNSLSTSDADGRRRPKNRLLWYIDLADRLVGLRVGLCKEPVAILHEFWTRTKREWVGCNCANIPAWRLPTS